MIPARDDDASDRTRGADAGAQSPERALAALWRALRHATLALGERALAQQAEAAVRADAVVAHGVTRLKSYLSAAGDGPLTPEASMTESTDNEDTAATPTAPRNAADGGSADAGAPADAANDPAHLLERLRAALAGSGAPYRYDGVDAQIESAVKQSNDTVLAAAGEFAYGHRAATDAFAAGLRQVSDAQHRQNLQTLQAAALAVCLDAMLRQPQQADEYAGLLEAIKHIV